MVSEIKKTTTIKTLPKTPGFPHFVDGEAMSTEALLAGFLFSGADIFDRRLGTAINSESLQPWVT